MATNRNPRINDRIRVSPVRLIGPDGSQIGILPTGEALQRARDLNLDLVEISPDARPPVCRILDYGKYKYEISKKEKQNKKKQQSSQLKEMRYRPKIDDHDFEFKTKHLREFLLQGAKVRPMVQFRGREMAHQEFGRKIIQRVIENLSDISNVDVAPKMEGNMLSAVLSPKSEIVKKLQKDKQQKTRPESDGEATESQ